MAREEEIVFCSSDKKLPLYVFIHGLAMDCTIWTAPEKTRVMAGNFTLDLFLSTAPDQELKTRQEAKRMKSLTIGSRAFPLQTLYHDVKALGAPCLAWSQQRPAGGIHHALENMDGIIQAFGKYATEGLVLIGHSRGGIIASKWAQLARPGAGPAIRGLVTIGSPHGGAGLATWAQYLSLLTSKVTPLLGVKERRPLLKTIHKVLRFIECEAVRELVPGSPLVQSLKNTLPDSIFTLSVGGARAELFSLYRARMTPVEGQPDMQRVQYRKLFSIPGSLAGIMPDALVPEELQEGQGDGLVALESSRLPGAAKHLTFQRNHLEMLFSEEVRQAVLAELAQRRLLP